MPTPLEALHCGTASTRGTCKPCNTAGRLPRLRQPDKSLKHAQPTHSVPLPVATMGSTYPIVFVH